MPFRTFDSHEMTRAQRNDQSGMLLGLAGPVRSGVHDRRVRLPLLVTAFENHNLAAKEISHS
eukprot:12468854-Alexandrium_andersonii.AAC.1